MDRSDQETQFYERIRRGDRLRIGAVVGIVLAIAFSVAVTVAASPEPSDGSGSPALPSASSVPSDGSPTDSLSPAATLAPAATAAPDTTAAPHASAAPNGQAGPGRGGWGPGFGPRFGSGGSGSVFGPITVSAINGTSVSLKTADGWTRTISVDDSVKVTKGGATASLSDLKVGDEVRLRQTKATDGTYTVTDLEIVLPVVFGQVTAKTSDTITIKLLDGSTSTIHVGSGTTYRVGGVDNPTLADIAVDSYVVALGTKRADGSLDAVSVGSGFGHGMSPGGRGPAGGWPFGPKPNDGPKASPGATTTPG